MASFDQDLNDAKSSVSSLKQTLKNSLESVNTNHTDYRDTVSGQLNLSDYRGYVESAVPNIDPYRNSLERVKDLTKKESPILSIGDDGIALHDDGSYSVMTPQGKQITGLTAEAAARFNSFSIGQEQGF